MITTIKKVLISALALLLTVMPASAINSTVRIMDITHVKGVRDNQVIGYGVVVGLPGTGDNSRSTQITNKMLLLNLGTVIEQENYIQKGSTAAVIVTATIPPFAKNGDRIDVTVSTMADAKSLEGGVLVQTILKAPNGEAIAVAQGPLSVAGVNAKAGGSSTRTTITTTGRIPGGAIMERDMVTDIGDADTVTLSLDNADYTLISRIAQTISSVIAPAKALDGTSVQVTVPEQFKDDRVGFLSILENLEVNPTMEKAKVIVNERTGTVVLGADVKLLPAAVAHGNLTVTVTTTNEVSQPNAFAQGSTVGFSNSEIIVNKTPGSVIAIPANSNLNDLVRALNSIGVTPVDLIAILQALKKSGSLQAELIII
ncbi:MAG TPA: flagellar basal body P-ring protein FlgI [Candidatus Gastranaerophilaceae bacterium]|nr:flagellar basal body P-ring protein FlgI [Candidatus Gastranaerophilaceae bacterium]HPT41906.1 flagellar basal body P-ring protein FlgI [Candidatus Gastranaerophilaceae bacterium]